MAGFSSGDYEKNLSSTIENFVLVNISGSVPKQLYRDEEAKKKVEKVMIKKLHSFISLNWRDITPPGFFYRPSDEMLIDMLSAKITDRPLPRVTLPEVEIFKIHPWNMAQAEHRQPRGYYVWHMFTHLDEDAPKSKFANRMTPFGYWKVNVLGERIFGDHVIGEKTYLTLYDTHNGEVVRTNWKMQLYRLSPHRNSRWVVCKVYNIESIHQDHPWM